MVVALKKRSPLFTNRMATSNRLAWLAFGAVCIIWGLTWVATKEAVRVMPPLHMVGVRLTIAGSLFVGYFRLKGHKIPGAAVWRHILLLALLNFVLSNALAAWGVKLTTAGLSAIIAAIYPIWLALILALAMKSKIKPLAWLGIVLGFGGICLVFYQHLQDLFNPGFIWGIGLGLAAAIAWAYGTIYTKSFAAKFNPYHSIGWQMLISGVFIWIVASFTDQTVPFSEITVHTWSAVIFLALIGSITAFIAFLYALQHLPTSLVSVYAYINPIVAVLAGAWISHEPLTAMIMLGTVITLAGVYLVNKSIQSIRS